MFVIVIYTLSKMSRIFQFYSEMSHYGDTIFNLRFFYNIASFLKENDIKVLYFYDCNYIKNRIELDRYVDTEVVTLLDITDPRFKNPTQNLWMAESVYGFNIYQNFIEYFNKYYLRISNMLGLTLDPLYTNFFQPEFYLENIYNKLDPKYKNLDILIINSEPQSEQFEYNKPEFDRLCRKLSESYKVATTTFVNSSIPCTFEDGLTIQDIGAISTKAKYIMGVLSGPMTACFNKLTIDHVDRLFILCTSLFAIRHSKIQTMSKLRTLDTEFRLLRG